jgi:hypothetical protein
VRDDRRLLAEGIRSDLERLLTGPALRGVRRRDDQGAELARLEIVGGVGDLDGGEPARGIHRDRELTARRRRSAADGLDVRLHRLGLRGSRLCVGDLLLHAGDGEVGVEVRGEEIAHGP